MNIKTAQTEIAKPVKPILPKPAPVSLVKVRWFVIRTESGNLIALDTKNYENLAHNMVEILRYIKEVESQLNYYTEDSNERPPNPVN